MVRTDFSSPASWEGLCQALVTPSEEGFLPTVDPVDDPRFAGVTLEHAMNLLPDDYQHPLLVLADRVALTSAELPLVVGYLWEQPARSVRVIAAELWGIENNLAIGNMGFEEFAESVDEDGVFRGF